MFGVNYNNVRKEKEIPLIDSNWKVNRTISEGNAVYTPAKIHSKRYHLKKTIEINYLSGIVEEYDYYIIEDKRISIDVIYNYKEEKHWYIRYFGQDKTMTELSIGNFIDTLKKYKIDN